MYGENSIQLVGYVLQIRFFPQKTKEELVIVQAQLDAEYEARCAADPEGTYRRRKSPRRSDMFLASLKCRNPVTQRWSDFWKFYCYGYMARKCHVVCKEDDRVMIQGIPTIRTNPKYQHGVGRLPHVWCKGIYPAYSGLQAEMMRKLHMDGTFTVDMVTDEEVGL